MTAPALDVAGVVVRFGAVTALDAVDLSVAPGEVAAIVGPSGCGKSTLLRVIAGLQPPASGRVRAFGRDLTDVPAHQRAIGLMFQHHALFPQRDVAGNVSFGLERLRTPKAEAERTVDRMLELVGLHGYGSRRITELSGGEQQRVALARALAPAPSLLLLDEPLGALDASLRQRLVRDLGALIDELELTVVAVTHDRDEAFALADRLVVMDGGRILQAGSPAALWADPADPRVAELLELGTVVPAEVRDGLAAGVWGAAPVSGAAGPGWVLIRPDAIVFDEGGSGVATVGSVVFQGATTSIELVVAGDGPVLRCDVPSDGAPSRGAQVRFAIDPGGVQRVG